MQEVPQKFFEQLESALILCCANLQTVDGLRIGAPNVSPAAIEMAACAALMSLTNSYVRPQGTKFIAGFGSSNVKEF